MYELVNRILLWLICTFVMTVANGITIGTIASGLFCLQLICIGLYFNKAGVKLCIVCIFAILSFKYSILLFFLPLILYEYTGISVSLFPKSSLARAATILSAVFLCASFVNNYRQMDNIYIGILILSGIAAIYVAFFSYRYYELKSATIRTRDNNMELTLALKNQNQFLIEKQNYEIYLATLHERNRIAREIHDNVGHMLSRSILQMGAVLVVNKEKSLEPMLLGVKDTLDLAMGRIRESVHDLHDESIDIRAAVREIIEKDLKGFQVSMDYDMEEVVPREIKYCFISVIREAVSNINKHCNGDCVFISMREHPVFYRLEVSDNGVVRFDKKKGKLDNVGIGLENIKERVENLQGTSHFSYQNGFKIVISIPKKD